MNVLLDLDGVVWLAEQPIAGSPGAVRGLRDAGHRLLFLTNNSNPTVDDLLAKLRGMDVDAAADEIVTSAQAAASLLEPGNVALVCGGQGVVQAVEARDARAVHEGPADAVIVGFHREFDYRRLTAAFRAVRAGARLIGTNDDPTYPTPEGPVPGGGSLLAAVAVAASADPVVAGKPNEAMADLVRARLGDVAGTVLIGDRPSTDGLMARRLGVPFVLVLSGVTEAPPIEESEPDQVAPDLASAVDRIAELQETA